MIHYQVYPNQFTYTFYCWIESPDRGTLLQTVLFTATLRHFMLYVPYRTTTVMQITEYNLLSQSTNVYPLAPKDQCIHFCMYVRICIHIYAFTQVYIQRAYTHTHTHNTYTQYKCTYVCKYVLRRCDKQDRWVSRSRLLADETGHPRRRSARFIRSK